MLFNSFDFAVFLPLVFLIHWIVGRGSRWRQNLILLAASYVFYGWWDWRFLGLIVLSTGVDYLVGLGLVRTRSPRSRLGLLLVSIVVNLGMLGFFKYCGFFLGSLEDAFSLLGVPLVLPSLEVVLPVGISFYTFQTMSYTLDVYRGRIAPTRDPVAFATYVAFFPQLVAGPIERARTFLPQFGHPRDLVPDQVVAGLRQILWGLFKKCVVADNCGLYVTAMFADPGDQRASSLLVGIVLFAIQIYGDFSGYSDIAIGTARLFGVRLMRNFAYPLFSRNLAEFWRRWHISLTTWFRDYLFLPLCGRHCGRWAKVRNTWIVFLVSGLWHGADWTFVIWGALHAACFTPHLLGWRARPPPAGRRLPTPGDVVRMLLTFVAYAMPGVFFRAGDLGLALTYCRGLWDRSLLAAPRLDDGREGSLLVTVGLVGVLLALEWIGREHPHALARLGLGWPRPLRWALYAVLVFAIGMLTPSAEIPFIYFRF